MKTLYIIAAFLLFASTGHATGTSREDSTKQAYISAKQEIEKMLDGKTELSYEKAIYQVENAWYNNQLDKEKFISAIDGHENVILRIMLDNWHPPKDTADIFTDNNERRAKYAKALANWAIYKYLTDTVKFKNGTFHAPYQYSTADPFGSIDWTNTQVSSLDKTGQGNCFALSSLFKILADRIGSEATLCTAPGHIFINHADNKGTPYNVEVGSRDFPGSGTIGTLTYSTTEGIRNNIELRELDGKQAVALCLVYLAKGYEHKYGTKTDEFLLDCANTTLKYDGHDLNAMLLKAEVLETRLAMQRRPINQLRTDKVFIGYEKLIANLYNLGYREIPKDMKGLLIRTYTIDSVRALQAKAYMSQTRYASLSWGMIDEAHKEKPTELYGHTVFNTATRKIKGFTKPDDGISYNFDPVVFALSVDPLTASYPMLTPYQFASNTPIQAIDLDGLEKYVVTNYYNKYKQKTRTEISGIRDVDTKEAVELNLVNAHGQRATNSNVFTTNKYADNTIRDDPASKELDPKLKDYYNKNKNKYTVSGEQDDDIPTQTIQDSYDFQKGHFESSPPADVNKNEFFVMAQNYHVAKPIIYQKTSDDINFVHGEANGVPILDNSTKGIGFEASFLIDIAKQAKDEFKNQNPNAKTIFLDKISITTVAGAASHFKLIAKEIQKKLNISVSVSVDNNIRPMNQPAGTGSFIMKTQVSGL